MNLWTIGTRWGRLGVIFVLLQLDVVFAIEPSLPIVHKNLKPSHISSTNAKSLADIVRLKELVSLGEKALAEKNNNSAFSWFEQAETLLDALPNDAQKTFDVIAARARLADFKRHLNDDKKVSLRLNYGLNGAVEPSSHSLEYLNAAAELIKKANQAGSNNSNGALYDFPIDLNNKVISWFCQFTTQKRHFMENTLSRASQYLPMVHQIFAEEHVPKDLAYLAVIESGFLNSASSCAKAVGMWQFMRSTGKNYGLTANAWVEERRDPVKATRAAAKYLKQLYKISGDWYLALVGYNAGPRAFERAILNLGTRNFWDMHRSRWLRNQTKDYVPELCAAILIGRFPEQYGFKIEKLAPYTYDTIEVDRMTSLPVLARYSNIDIDKLKRLNPELIRNTTPPGRYLLRVPSGMGKDVTHILTQIPDDQRSNFMFYNIKKRDTLAKVATKFNISTDDLLKINNISKSEFRPGNLIQVPPTLAVLPNSRHQVLQFKTERKLLAKHRSTEEYKFTNKNHRKDAVGLHLKNQHIESHHVGYSTNNGSCKKHGYKVYVDKIKPSLKSKLHRKVRFSNK